MSETAPPLPLFFTRVVGVNPKLHGDLRLNRGTDYRFAAAAHSIPLGLGEFEIASRHYPILFTAGTNPVPVALVGLGEHGNLFVNPDGTWRADSYVPAYCRAFPFVFVEDAPANTTFVAMQAEAACLGTETGQNLFEDETPTQALNDAIGFCATLRDSLRAAGAMARAMEEAGLLQDEEATVNFTAGGGTRVRGFKVLKPGALETVSDEIFLDWRRRGWLPSIYAHLLAAGQWARLIDLAAQRNPATSA
jgi:hypothetical protein